MKQMQMMPTVTLMIAMLFFLPACATTSMQPLAPGALTVKILPAASVRIVQTSARQDGANVVIDGHVQREKVHGRMIPTGHVDIALLDEKGKTIQAIFTRVTPEILPRMHGVKSSFMAQIPVMAPKGSVVRVKFHSGPHSS